MSGLKDKEAYNAYMRVYMAKRFRGRREAAIVSLGGKCAICGSTDNLQFDHRDPNDKTFDIAKIWLHSKKKLMQELTKCQILCKSCHEDKSISDLGHKKARGTHGTLSSHRYCKCELCRKAHSEYVKGWKLRKRNSMARKLAL